MRNAINAFLLAVVAVVNSKRDDGKVSKKLVNRNKVNKADKIAKLSIENMYNKTNVVY